jgi:hypothetical protein
MGIDWEPELFASGLEDLVAKAEVDVVWGHGSGRYRSEGIKLPHKKMHGD